MIRCGFCGEDGCRAHSDLVMPWEDLPGRRGPKPRRAGAEMDRSPLGLRDDFGQIVVVAAWCPECLAMVALRDDGYCGSCGEWVFDESAVKVSEVKFV